MKYNISKLGRNIEFEITFNYISAGLSEPCQIAPVTA